MKYYPIYLNLKDRLVLIVGAGQVAWQKVKGLAQSEARIRIVAPDAVAEIEELARSKKVEWLSRAYQTSDLEKVQLVFAATDDPVLQKKVAAEARERGIWVNVVDVTPLCDFIAPAVMARGDVQIAVSTGGASPALARFIREKLETLFGAEYGQLAELLQKHRPEILKLPQPRRQALWEAIINQEFVAGVKRDGLAAAETRLQDLIKHG